MVFLLPLPLPKFRLGMDIDDGCPSCGKRSLTKADNRGNVQSHGGIGQRIAKKAKCSKKRNKYSIFTNKNALSLLDRSYYLTYPFKKEHNLYQYCFIFLDKELHRFRENLICRSTFTFSRHIYTQQYCCSWCQINFTDMTCGTEVFFDPFPCCQENWA